MTTLPLATADWNAVCDEAVGYLSGLLQIDTTNPPGRERAAAEYLASILAAKGLEPVVLESAPGRGQVVARLRGSEERPPLLLFSHTDVVPAEPDHWTVPPFSGLVQDGYIWGRGALDMKSIVIMHLMALLLLKRTGQPLARDVIFASTADEERAGWLGMGWLVDHHPELIRAGYGLSEFGGFSYTIAGRRVYLCQTGEKGFCTVRLSVRGRPGHGSIPHTENAITRLAALLARLGPDALPSHPTATVRAFLATLADVLPGAAAGSLATLLNDDQVNLATLRRLLGEADLVSLLNAMLRNTATPTSLAAGTGAAFNVIPSVAGTVLDARLLPGFDRERFLDELRVALAPGEFETEIIYEGAALEFPLDTPLFGAIRRILHRHDPAAALAPMLMAGATDARHVARLGTICYGFAPMRLKPDEQFLRLVHGHDERIAIENLGWGLRVFAELVAEFSRRAPPARRP